jgi:hypothetical protein
MKMLWLPMLLLAVPLAGCNVPDDDEKLSQELNVNSRYLIESVHVSGQRNVNISDPLRTELDQVVGRNLDHPMLEKLAERIKKELHVSEVAIKVARGSEPNHVVVDFEVTRGHQPFDLKVAKFLYNSKEGWTADGSATTTVHGNAFTLGLLSDGDSLVERFAGLRAVFERKNLGTDRLHLRFEFDTYHEQWNEATLLQASSSDIYRSRQVFMPGATLVIAPPLEWSFGVSFARLRVPSSGLGAAAANTESSNAVVNTLRYHQRWGSEGDEQQQEVSASYALAAATGWLETDRVFTRHMAQGHYKFRHARNKVDVGFLAGHLNGNAPLYERFTLGDSTTLRGWNKFDLDPLGGSHVVHGSIDYQYRIFQVFYDTGAVWDRPQDREQKQSVGVGFKKECFQLAVAFPLRAGHADPIFYAGMNF